MSRAFLLVAIGILCFCPSKASVKRVIVIFSNHLDIGFHSATDGIPGTDAAVITKYFKDYFPAAIAVIDELRKQGSALTYRYLTHSYLVSLYLDCPLQLGIYCPSPREVAAFEDAVRRGDVTWHAFPHNAQVEFFDDDLLEWAVQMTQALDRRFGFPPKRTMSQRDVPGLTRAAIPSFIEAGLGAVSVGVNGGSAPPDVPLNTPFLWKDERSGFSVLAMWHAGGYSGWPVDSRDECVAASGLDTVLCCAWRGDNAGPHSIDEIEAIYAQLHDQFPEAETIEAGTLDDFIAVVQSALPELDLPVFTGEIGDTWIHGIGSDPARVAEFRALLRVRKASRERWEDPDWIRFSRLLLKVSDGVYTFPAATDLVFYRWDRRTSRDERALAQILLYSQMHACTIVP